MADYQKRDHKQKKKNKYPMQPMMIPVGGQPLIYPPPVVGQPQPIYPMQPQPYAMPIVQPINGMPRPPNQVVTVPVGPPITVNQPIGAPVMMPAQALATPPPQPPQVIQQPVVVQQQKPPIIIIKKYRQSDDGCCTIF